MHNRRVPAGGKTGNALRQIVDRIDLDALTERVLDSFWDRPDYRRFRPPRDEVRAWVRWNVDLVIRWLVDDQPPTAADLQTFRERAQQRAGEGMPADVVPANFRAGAREAWTAMLEAADEHERPALLEGADLLFEYVDRVSNVFSDTYGADTAAAATEDERSARALLGRLAAGGNLTADDLNFAEGKGVTLEGKLRPFVLTAPTGSPQQHEAVARRLRSDGALAAAEGERVVGLAHDAIPVRALGLGPSGIITQDEPTERSRLPEAFEELHGVVDIAVRRNLSGSVRVDDHLVELLLALSPRVAARLRGRVYQSLDPELVRTLDSLLAHDFDRGATAASLPVHRNTLNNRLRRVRSLTGLDLARTEGRGLAWLAWLQRRSS